MSFTLDSQAALRMTQVLQRAIQRGVPVYNAGNPSECAAIYQTALEDLLLLSADSFANGVAAINSTNIGDGIIT